MQVENSKMIYRGSGELARVYRGTTVVWEPNSGDTFAEQYLTLEASGVPAEELWGPNPPSGVPSVYYGGRLEWKHYVESGITAETGYTVSVSKDDGNTWTDYVSTTGGTVIGTLQQGDKWLFRAMNGNRSWNAYPYFSGLAIFNAYGNMLSMLQGEYFGIFDPDMSGPGAFEGLFAGTNIISAENLVFPQPRDLTTHSRRYSGSRKNMFAGCTHLRYPPKVLTATYIRESHYEGMFKGCTRLVKAPNIMATRVDKYGMRLMFSNCPSLQTAPVLRATYLSERCYADMFLNCTGLTSAPFIGVGVVGYGGDREGFVPQEAFDSMFSGCTNLSYVKCLATELGRYATYGWLSGVSPTGTFVKSPDMNDWETGDSGIPSGWTVENASA